MIVPPGVSDSFSDVTATPARRAPTATPRYVCFVGSLEPRKNLSTLLDAMEVVRQTTPELKLVIVGNSERRPSFVDSPCTSISRGFDM